MGRGSRAQRPQHDGMEVGVNIEKLTPEERWAWNNCGASIRQSFYDVDAFQLWVKNGMDLDVLERAREIRNYSESRLITEDVLLEAIKAAQ